MSVRDANSAEWRRSQIPAASGFGNAHSVALFQSVMAGGGTRERGGASLPAMAGPARGVARQRATRGHELTPHPRLGYPGPAWSRVSRQWVGDIPRSRLNARLNASCDS
jgi:hypothetical protein